MLSTWSKHFWGRIWYARDASRTETLLAIASKVSRASSVAVSARFLEFFAYTGHSTLENLSL